ncbi:hypothetical protein T492DRAFT_911698 [Pavlovales sp. CCMP2436]|nr:hypothetical protein T492DRAFT_911698 [Pavlovales sp. CCMP2436]
MPLVMLWRHAASHALAACSGGMLSGVRERAAANLNLSAARQAREYACVSRYAPSELEAEVVDIVNLDKLHNEVEAVTVRNRETSKQHAAKMGQPEARGSCWRRLRSRRQNGEPRKNERAAVVAKSMRIDALVPALDAFFVTVSLAAQGLPLPAGTASPDLAIPRAVANHNLMKMHVTALGLSAASNAPLYEMCWTRDFNEHKLKDANSLLSQLAPSFVAFTPTSFSDLLAGLRLDQPELLARS